MLLKIGELIRIPRSQRGALLLTGAAENATLEAVRSELSFVMQTSKLFCDANEQARRAELATLKVTVVSMKAPGMSGLPSLLFIIFEPRVFPFVQK